MTDQLELTVVLPCLNEAETVEICIKRALGSMAELGIKGEVLVADNGSTDGSQELSRAAGARVVDVPIRGYGAALRYGIEAANSEFIIMGDADDSYALEDLGPFVEQLRAGADLVMGNRFKGGIAPGAMPPLHRYLGNPVLSYMGRLFFKIDAGDFHCGMRGFRRDKMVALGLTTTGMEFASEMIVRASQAGFDIREVPTTLRKDGRSRPPHLRTWRDGWRHLRFLLAFSPRWLLLYPSFFLITVGLVLVLVLEFGDKNIGHVSLSINTMLVAATMVIVGLQMLGLAVVSRAYAAAMGLQGNHTKIENRLEQLVLGDGVWIGLLLGLAGLAVFAVETWKWRGADFHGLQAAQTVRIMIIGMLLIVVGAQTIFSSFTLSLTRVGEI